MGGSGLEALFDDARSRLRTVQRDGLGEVVVPRRILGIPRAARIADRGRVWHLGALLLSDDAVLATGQIIRSRAEVRRGYTAESQRERALLAAAARRGGFPEGFVVHVGWQMIDLAGVEQGSASGPLQLRDGRPHVRWSPRGGFMPLEAYLGERVELLLDPPAGAT